MPPAFRPRVFDADRAAEAGAETAGHRHFDGRLAGHAEFGSDVRDRFQHRRRAAAEDLGLVMPFGFQMRGQNRSYETFFSFRAVIGR